MDWMIGSPAPEWVPSAGVWQLTLVALGLGLIPIWRALGK